VFLTLAFRVGGGRAGPQGTQCFPIGAGDARWGSLRSVVGLECPRGKEEGGFGGERVWGRAGACVLWGGTTAVD